MEAVASSVELEVNQPGIDSDIVPLASFHLSGIENKNNKKKQTTQKQKQKITEEEIPIIESQTNPLFDIERDIELTALDNSTQVETKENEEVQNSSNNIPSEEIQETDSNKKSIMPQFNTKIKIGLACCIFTSILVIIYYASDNIPFHLIEDACDWIKNNMLIGALLFIPVEIIWYIPPL